MTRAGAGTDFLGLSAASAPARGLTTWLTAAIRDAVADGRLTAGARLPATRTLAADLGIARGVAVEAYQRLIDEGLLSGRPGAGTVVLSIGTAAAAGPGRPEATRPGTTGPSTTGLGNTGLGNTGPSTAARPGVPRLPLPATHRPEPAEYDLSPGVPDLAAFPRAAWLRAERAVLRDMTVADLGYGDPRGSARLRVVLAGWLATTRGVRAAPEDILVVAGVAQSLALLAQTVRAAGQTALAVEDPGSRGAHDEMAHWGLRLVPVRVDGQGLDVEALERAESSTVLVTPAHQFPTGVVLSPARRRGLLDWARHGDRLVIEDDYDAEHRYDRAPVRALQPAAADHVAHTGSTSKTLAPGMRLGWLVPPRRLQADLIAAKHASDLGSPAVPQLVLAHLIDSGEYDRHLRLVRSRQRRRRDAVLAALAEYLPWVRVEGVAAGLHLLISWPPDGPADDVELATAIRQRGVVVHPLSWHRQQPGPPGLILGYAAQSPDRLHHAVRRIAAVLGGRRASSGTRHTG